MPSVPPNRDALFQNPGTNVYYITLCWTQSLWFFCGSFQLTFYGGHCSCSFLCIWTGYKLSFGVNMKNWGDPGKKTAISYTIISISSNHSQTGMPEGDFFASWKVILEPKAGLMFAQTPPKKWIKPALGEWTHLTGDENYSRGRTVGQMLTSEMSFFSKSQLLGLGKNTQMHIRFQKTTINISDMNIQGCVGRWHKA